MSADAQRDFYASGEVDVARAFTLIGPGFAPRNALDFGCGVGRLTRALTKRVPRVVGVDVAPTMLARAAEAVPEAEFTADLPDEEFDLIISLIVLQHVRVPDGMRLMRGLLSRLSREGAAVLHVTVARPGSPLRRLARQARARVPAIHRLATLLEGRTPLPYIEMNVYDLEAVRELFVAAGCAQVAEETTNHGGIEGRILVARKSPSG